MKKVLLTLAVVLLTVAAQAQTQTSFKVHNDGRISLQSATTSYGIQIPTNGVMSIEPNITSAYDITSISKLRHLLAKALVVKVIEGATVPTYQSFYVFGNGNVFTYGSYLTYSPPESLKNNRSIEGASELVMGMNGYFMDSKEFEGITPEDFENNENIIPEAVEGLLKDLERNKTVGMYAKELEAVLPEAVRHTAEGGMAINYNAVVTVLVEAFKEQQAKIEHLETILRENGLGDGKK